MVAYILLSMAIQCIYNCYCYLNPESRRSMTPLRAPPARIIFSVGGDIYSSIFVFFIYYTYYCTPYTLFAFTTILYYHVPAHAFYTRTFVRDVLKENG